jgi:peptidoglycan hydrolase CwlO-like protein
MDPFSIKLHTKIAELETKLSEENDAFADLYNENCEHEEKIVELTKKLEDAEKALADIKAQYLCCRQAAQTFIDSTAESDTQG